ncbi:MAG: metalloregulator ArsR/SmtB family transcription factor [Devosia sp.]
MPAAARADDRLDQVFHALANRTRRALLRRLATGTAKVGDLAAPFGMSLNAVSKHILVLEDAGLVRRTVLGREHICALNAGPMATAEQWLDFYSGYWNNKLDRLAAFVEKDSK